MKKLVSVLLLFVALAAVLYFWTGGFDSVRDPYEAVPVDAALVLEVPATGQFINQLASQTNYIAAFETMDFYQSMKQELLSFDSLASFENPDFTKAFSFAPSLAVMIETQEGYGFVYILNVGNNLKMYQISNAAAAVFGNRAGVVERKFGGYKTATIVDKRKQKQLSYCITGGILIAGYDRQAFERALIQLDEKTGIINDAQFTRVKTTTGKQANAYLFVNFSRMGKFFQTNAAEPYQEAANGLAKAAGSWAAFDFGLKPDQLLLNGFVLPDDQLALNPLLSHDAEPATLFQLMPYDTRLFVHFGMKGLNTFFGSVTDSSKVEALSRHASMDLGEMIRDRIGDEMAVGFRQGDKSTKAFAVALIEDSDILTENLTVLSTALSGTNVRAMNGPLLSSLLPVLFGDAFAAIDRMHYQIEGKYLFAANNAVMVEQLINIYHKGRSLGNAESFKSFSNHLSPVSNVLIYGNLREGLDLIHSFFNSQLVYQVNRNRQALTSFQAVAIQLTSSPPFLYTNAVANFQPGVAEEGSVAWQTALDAEVAGAVSLVVTQADKPALLAAFDSRNQMYLLNEDGNIVWKKQLQSPVISSVTTIYRSKNKQPFLLFNTSGHLYLVDLKGNDAQGFPVRLKAQATNPLSIGKTGADDYQILVSCSDKITYSYGINGKETKGWGFPKSQDIVTKPIVKAGSGNLTYVVIEDASGNLRIADKNGKQRITIKGLVDKAPNAVVSLNRTNSKGVLITTNTSGKLLYISGSGSISTTDFGDWSSGHYFIYDDFSQNRSDDFIFLDKEKLVIFDRFKKILFEYAFVNEITAAPYFVSLPGNQRMLCVTDDVARELYLIDKHGRMLTASGLTGDTPVRPVSFDQSGDIFLVTGSGSNLICYQLY